jgi:hypothetical protein
VDAISQVLSRAEEVESWVKIEVSLDQTLRKNQPLTVLRRRGADGVR